MSTKDERAKQALMRRQQVSRPLTGQAAAAAAPAASATAEAPAGPPATKPAGAAAKASGASSAKPKASGAKATGSKRPAGTKRVTLDADQASLEAFQSRVIEHGWSQRAGLTAALNLFLGLDDERFDELCRKAQIEARRR